MKPTATPLSPRPKRPSLLLLPRPPPLISFTSRKLSLVGSVAFFPVTFCFVFLLIPSLFNSLATLLVYFFFLVTSIFTCLHLVFMVYAVIFFLLTSWHLF